MIERDNGVLAGFNALSATMIPLAHIPAEISRELPRYPAALIGWLGPDERFSGQGIGALLLYDPIHRVAASHLGVLAFLANAIDNGAAAFYREHQFTPLTSRPRTEFLSIAKIRALAEQSDIRPMLV